MDALRSVPKTVLLLQNPFWLLSQIRTPRCLSCWKESSRPKADYLNHLVLKLRTRGFIHPLPTGTSARRGVCWSTRASLNFYCVFYGTLWQNYICSSVIRWFFFQNFLFLTRSTSICVNTDSTTCMTKQVAVSCV